MSHFTVLVIGDNIEKQLEPFWELDLSLQKLMKDPRAEFISEIPKSELNEEYKEWKENYKEKEEDYSSLEEWVKDWYGYNYNSETDSYGYYANPNAKWDWYVIGGRWSGQFILKKGAKGTLGEPGVFDNKPFYDADSAKKGDIDFEEMKKRNDGHDFSTFAVVKDGKWYERGEMGWWGMVANEKDESLWKEEFKKLIENLPDDTLLTVVDCHI